MNRKQPEEQIDGDKEGIEKGEREGDQEIINEYAVGN